MVSLPWPTDSTAVRLIRSCVARCSNLTMREKYDRSAPEWRPEVCAYCSFHCRADFGYNNGTASTPNIDAWAKRQGSIVLQDYHSGGTVCSPTRATVLTGESYDEQARGRLIRSIPHAVLAPPTVPPLCAGRTHFRDCVDFVYGCS